MSKFQKPMQEALTVLEQAKAAINEILSDPMMRNHQARLDRVLTAEINSIKSVHKLGKLDPKPERAQSKPLTKFFGRDLKISPAPTPKTIFSSKAVSQKPAFKSAQEVENEEFADKALELYPQFLDLSTESIWDEFDEMFIRGVAVLAGLQWDEKHPKEINVKEIEEIKAAIRRKKELENVGNSANKEGDDAVEDENFVAAIDKANPNETDKQGDVVMENGVIKSITVNNPGAGSPAAANQQAGDQSNTSNKSTEKPNQQQNTNANQRKR